jgi:hypothetical protein
MVIPIPETEDGNRGAGGNQNPNGVIDIGLDAGDPDLIQENFDQLSKSFFLIRWQRSEKGDMKQKHLFPQSGEPLFHNFQPPHASATDQPIEQWGKTDEEQNGMPEPAATTDVTAAAPVSAKAWLRFRRLLSRVTSIIV